jgi:hypothetical protein
MANVNYQFEKRRRDMEKKRKQEAKRLNKLAKKDHPSSENAEGGEPAADAENAEPTTE